MLRSMPLTMLLGVLLASCALPAPAPRPTTVPPSTAVADPNMVRDAPQTGPAATITFGASGSDRMGFEPLIEAFQAANPDIQVQFVDLDPIYRDFFQDGGADQDMDALIKRLASAVDTLPAPPITNTAIRNGYFRDLQPLMDADAGFRPDDFYPRALDEMRRAEITFGVPRVLHVPLLVYNTSLFATAGLPPPPHDWMLADISRAAEHLALKNGGLIQRYGVLGYDIPQMMFHAEAAAQGVDLHTAAIDAVRLDTPELAHAVETMSDQVRTSALYLVPPFTSAGTLVTIQDFIARGQVGIYEPGYFGLDPTQPESAAWDYRLRPVLAGDYAGTTDSYVMSGGTRHPVAAWRWLSFLSQQYVTLLGDGREHPAAVLPARPSIAAQIGHWEQAPVSVRTALESALATRSLPLTVRELDESPQQLYWPLLVEVILAVAQDGQSPDVALRDAQAALDAQVVAAQAQPSPTPDPQPLAVATPVLPTSPRAGPPLRFGVTRFRAAAIRQAVEQLSAQQPDLAMQLIDLEPTTLASAARQSDCFSWSAPPAPADLTDAVRDLQPLLDADPRVAPADLPPAVRAPFQRDGRLLGLPATVSLPTLSYHPQHLADAGLDPLRADASLDALLATAQQLTSGWGDQRVYGYAAAGALTVDLDWALRRAGVSLTTGAADALQPALTDPAMRAAVDWFVTLVQTASPHQRLSGYTQPPLADAGVQAFDQGRVGLWLHHLTSSPVSLPDGITPLRGPAPLGAGLTSADLQLSGLYINATTDQLAGCWAVLQAVQAATSDLGAGLGALTLPARQGMAVAGLSPADAALVEDIRQALATAQPGTVDLDPLARYWFYRAVDRALQGGDLARELDDAQLLTEQYLACVQGGAAAGTCARQVDPTYQGFAER
ncbi:MAG: extracellular solute-binding protein [Chloroflexales bacterium]|nr:extracellular solute-binding protein [Chloroflexales bacterium]